MQIRPELVHEVEHLLARHRIAPARLVLEITESLVLDPKTKPIVARLRELGVQLALDDFGTGYSSLGSLQRFPLDVVKLDRTLIASLATGKGIAVVKAAVELGSALGVHVIAEGIEGSAQLDTLRDIGCLLGQGFLFAKPLPVGDAERLLPEAPARTPPLRRRLKARFRGDRNERPSRSAYRRRADGDPGRIRRRPRRGDGEHNGEHNDRQERLHGKRRALSTESRMLSSLFDERV